MSASVGQFAAVRLRPGLNGFPLPDLAHVEHHFGLWPILPLDELLDPLAGETAEHAADLCRPHEVMHGQNHSRHTTRHLTRGQEPRHTSHMTSAGQMMTPDPAIWHQLRPGGPWYKIGKRSAHRVKECENCGQQFMGRYQARFCSVSCRARGRWQGDGVSYHGRHSRVYHARGHAADQVCIDCGEPAHEWSQVHGTTGAEPDHYEPRCRSCHRDYDLDLLPRGERHGCAKLTAAQVAEIRALWESEQVPGHVHRNGCGHSVEWTLTALAARFGIARSAVHRIVRNVTWRAAL